MTSEGARLKYDLVFSNTLTSDQINDIVAEVKKCLSKYEQPIRPYGVATITHNVMVEKTWQKGAVV